MRPKSTPEELRARAEEKAREEPEVGPGPAEAWSRQEVQEKLLELRIHQIELELQNEELRETRAELAQALLRYQDLFEHSPVAYLLLDATGRILRANATAAGLLGRSVEGLRGTSLASHVEAPGREGLQRALRKALGKTLSASCEVGLLEGENRLAHVDVLPAPAEGPEGGRVRVTLTDVTELRRVQDGLARVQHMESLGVLAGGMAHDYNTHLGIILTACNLLRQDAAPDSPQLDLIEEIEKAAEVSAGLNAKVLAFGRRQVLLPEVVEVGASVRASLDRLRRILGESIEVRVQAAPDPIFVSMDPDQLHQVVMNLAVNARDAMLGEGTFEVSIEEVELASEAGGLVPGGRYAVLAFQDEGTGIPEGLRERIFEPFVTTKSETRGTGLGLATVNGIVGQSGGKVEVSSAPGAGARFAVFLPRVEPPDDPASETCREVEADDEGVEASLSKVVATILLVEDEPSLRELGKRLLEIRGFKVVAFGSAEEALEFVDQGDPEFDLLYSDVVLPGMDGCELARRIRDLRPGIPILLTSGYPRNLLDLQSLQGEGLGFIRKPNHGPDLTRRIQDLLDQRTA